MFVQASSTPSTMRILSFSDNGNGSRKLRTNFRIKARLPVWLENSTFCFFIKPGEAKHHGAAGGQTENPLDSFLNNSSLSIMWKSMLDKPLEIVEIIPCDHCESGFNILLKNPESNEIQKRSDGSPRYIDTNWIMKINPFLLERFNSKTLKT